MNAKRRTEAFRRALRVAGWLVPRWRRREWRREWDAELASWDLEPGAPVAAPFADAVVLRGQSMHLDMWAGDVRFALRTFSRRPGFSLLVVTTLALGFGVGSGVFAVADAALLRPLPYPEPSRLAFVWQTLPSQHVFEVEATPSDFSTWHRARAFSNLAMLSAETFTLTGGGTEPERVRGARVSASLMPLLGLSPRLGRAFLQEEDSDQAAPVAVLSDGLWRRRFGGAIAAVGATIEINGVRSTIVGVLPPRTHLPGPLAGDDEVWLPLRMSAAERDDAISHNYTVLARLVPGVTAKAADAEMNAIARSQAVDQPGTHRGIGVRVVTASDQSSAPLRRPLMVLLAGVALLVLVASANVATLLLARTSERHHELAVRRAIGASSRRMLSLAAAESLVYSTAGAVVGLLVGSLVVDLLLAAFRDAMPPDFDAAIDGRVALATAAVAASTGVIFALLNASHARRTEPSDALHSGSRSIGSTRASRLRHTLVASQIALAVLLLTIGGLLIKSYARLSVVSPGFDARNVLTFRIALPEGSYGSAAQRASFAAALLDGIRPRPGNLSAAVNSRLPFGGSRGANGIEIEGRPALPGQLRIVDQREVTSDYFSVMNIPVVAGRTFTERDDGRSEPVAIVNRAMARRMWGGDSPIEGRVRVVAGDEQSGWLRVVGIVDDVRHISLGREPVPEMYRPFAQMPTPSFAVVLRTAADAVSAAPGIREAVLALDPRLPIYDVRTMESRIAASVAEARVTALLLLTTALLSALLAAIAIYGSIWYSVAQRTQEIGLRLALGASPLAVFRLVAARALGLAAIGSFAGVAAAVAGAPLVGSLLFETRPMDPAVYAIVALALMVTTLLASVVPARRAMRVDPLTALRM